MLHATLLTGAYPVAIWLAPFLFGLVLGRLKHLASVEAHSQMPLWMISGCGSAVLIIGLFLRAEHWVTRRLSWLVSAGRLSLTIYVAQLAIGDQAPIGLAHNPQVDNDRIRFAPS